MIDNFDYVAYWMTLVPCDLAREMRSHKVTIRELARETGLTMKQIRALRSVETMTRSERCKLRDAFEFIEAYEKERYKEIE